MLSQNIWDILIKAQVKSLSSIIQSINNLVNISHTNTNSDTKSHSDTDSIWSYFICHIMIITVITNTNSITLSTGITYSFRYYY